MKHTFKKFLFFLLQRQFLTIYDSLNSFAKLRYVCFVMDLYKNNVTCTMAILIIEKTTRGQLLGYK